ncbi:MAG: isocitrate/isopropylmalate dehydrogenase family protein [Candidatus Jordarchaeales archaeon]
MAKKVGYIEGDGIGHEIVPVTIEILEELVPQIELIPIEAGLNYMKKTGKNVLISDEALELAATCDAILKGPTETPPGPGSPKSVVVTLRQALDLYANVRPFQYPGKIDVIIVRENTEDLYKGIEHRLSSDVAIGVRVITRKGSKRIAEYAYKMASQFGRRKVTIVHKATVMKETCGLFRETCLEVASQYPSIETEEMHVDTIAMNLVLNPARFDVILTTNMFGDILSDLCAGIVGSIGLCPSANVGDKNAMFEAIHGSAPDIAGKGIANPAGIILAAALMLDYLGYTVQAKKLRDATLSVVTEKVKVTPDLGGNATTRQMAEEILRKAKQES